MEEIEIWKSSDILGHPLYELSTLGNMKNVKTGKLLSLKPTKLGYVSKTLIDSSGNEKRIQLHILLAKLYIPNPENKLFVDHINRIKNDNRVSNLRWFTPSENAKNADNKRTKESYRKVNQYTRDMKFIKEWSSAKEAADELNIDYNTIIEVCLGYKKTYKDCIWKYKEDEVIVGEIWIRLYINNSYIDLSNMGRVKFQNGKINDGNNSNKQLYFEIKIKKKNYRVNRLVMMAFKPIENCENFDVNHIDENKRNNKLENLEWTTRRENIEHSCAIRIQQIDVDGNIVNTFRSIKKAGEKLGIRSSSISRVVDKKYFKGFFFKKINE